MGSPLSSGEGSDSPFGATGESGGEDISVRVSRDMKRKLEIVKFETGESSMSIMVEKMVYDNLTDLDRMVGDMKYIVDLVNSYEDDIGKPDEERTFKFNNSITRLGKLHHNIKFTVYERYSGSMSGIQTAIHCSRSEVVRICLIKDITERIIDGQISLSNKRHENNIRDRWYSIRDMIFGMRRGLERFMKVNFVDNLEGTEWRLRKDSLAAENLMYEFEDFKRRSEYGDIREMVGNEPFDNLERILENV